LTVYAARYSEAAKASRLGHPGLGDLTIWHVANRVGESPAWHRDRQSLYWIDVRAQELLQLDPARAKLVRWSLPDVVGAMALCGSASCVLALRHTIVRMDLETGHLQEMARVEAERATNRLNDGKVSPTGNWFVFGSMDDRESKHATGALYAMATGGEVKQIFSGLVVANGIAWSRDGATLFFSDSFRGLLFQAPWNEAEGSIGVAQVCASLSDAQGRPDGACVDGQGSYWSAGVSAGVLNRFDAGGRLQESIALPCRAPTMCTFGGEDAQTMYVTSLVRPQWRDAPGLDGSLFSFASPVPGAFPAVLIRDKE
jgi:sugar lactone lactonase YvrE